jgi:hypothetical protein
MLIPFLRFRKRKHPLIIGLLSAIFIPLLLHASTGFAKTEQDIKVAYLFNFIKFIAWPESLDAGPFNLCILGSDPVNEKLRQLQGRKISQELTLEVLYLSKPDHHHCHVVFVGESEKKFIHDIVAFYSHTPTLTVSSMENFTNYGGMIGFITLGNIIRFNINLKQARETQLSISSKLLELANQVEQ